MLIRTLSHAGTGVVLASLTLSAAAGSPAMPAPQLAPGMGLSGEDAVRAFSRELPEIAERHGYEPQQLAHLLATDSSLRLTDGGDLFYVCPKPAHEEPMDESRALRANIDPADAFLLNSNPTASKTIYLDFDGHHSVGNGWGHNIVFPPFDRDGNPGSFTNGELNEIIGHWLQVVEDFAGYDVNVTTQDPGIGALTRSGGGDNTWGVRDIHTQATSGFGDGIGGVAFVGSFDASGDTPCFSFNKGTLNGGMTASHEVGHTLGLSHDGLNGSSYHPGTNASQGKTAWGPIMGAPFGRNVVQWSNGDYSGSTTTQNDTAIIANGSNGIGYLVDDHANSSSGATPLTDGVTVDGIIGTRTDVDVFSFTVPTCGEVTLNARPRDPGTNLDVLLTLSDSTGTTIATLNETHQVYASLTLSLDPGDYTVAIDGDGHPLGRYSDYGSMGEYTMTFTLGDTCPCYADIDADGDTDADDISLFVFLFIDGLWWTADLDGDGDNDSDDISLFVDSFIAGCP